MTDFPIDVSNYKPLQLSYSYNVMNTEEKSQLRTNIDLLRKLIVFVSGYSSAKGLGGHTGGAYDIVPEFLIYDGFKRGNETSIFDKMIDSAGHRVVLQYVVSALNGKMDLEDLLHYRESGYKLPGHPELNLTPGIDFSSGRLGHTFGMVNGLAIANPEKKIVFFSSDGCMQEGNNAEAIRFAVAHNLNVKLIIDDNNITISDHVDKYMPGFSIEKMLCGLNFPVAVSSRQGGIIPTNEWDHLSGTISLYGPGENITDLYERIRLGLLVNGPAAIVNHRLIAPGINGIENTPKAHDAISKELAIRYLIENQEIKAADMISSAASDSNHFFYLGSSQDFKKTRDEFGKITCEIIDGLSADEKRNVLFIDSDLGGSVGFNHIRKRHTDLFIQGGIAERTNFLAAAGFGMQKDKQGVFSTFAAFQEMIISELTMARLNDSNVLLHFSHSGVDGISDNNCHFGVNNFYSDGSFFENDNTRLYFPADSLQLKEMLRTIFFNPGLRFVYTTRSEVPNILSADGKEYFDSSNGYKFIDGKDEIIINGSKGFVVSYGNMLHRCRHVVEKLQEKGYDIGLINKPTLNVCDEESLHKIGKTDNCIVIEDQNIKTGLGVRMGTWLLERGYTPTYDRIGVSKKAISGQSEQISYQGLDITSIEKKIIGFIDS